ncbi:MAG: chromosomal replication initiator protein DnaA [Candidatus Omnitrophica bacterium]|nr:chromosomal replication initiator protein DnaA [Candidatus Omnitrophota bacterium]
MASNDPSVWLRARELIKKELDNDQAFNIWFGPVNFHSISEGTLTLAIPNKLFQDILLDRYTAVLNSSVAKSCGKEMRVEFYMQESPDDVGARQPNDAAAKEKAQSKTFWPFGREKQDAGKEIGLSSRYTFDSFVIGPSNRFAHAAASAVCDSPAKAYNPLFIYGGVGLGKTHLMHSIGHKIIQRLPKAKILYISSEEFTNQLIGAIQNRTMIKFREKYRNVDILLIDDIQFIAGKEATQEEFFHTFNTLYDAHKQIVVSSDRPPKEIQSLEERLVSRFEWGLVTDIQPPDFETRMAILKKKSEKETILLPDDVYYFLAEKIKSNIRELEGALIRVVAYAKLIGREISVDMVKEVLKDMIREGEKKITIEMIQKKVCEYFDIKLSDMKIKKRSRAIAYPRQIAMYLSRQLTDYSLPEIGEYFGGRDHTTVMHAYEKIKNDLKEKKGLSDLIGRVTDNIGGS